VGNAVTRNRLRRRLREAARQAALPPGAFLVRARPEAAQIAFSELVTHLRQAAAAQAAGRNRPPRHLSGP
jgi:ribonuclease P protein component